MSVEYTCIITLIIEIQRHDYDNKDGDGDVYDRGDNYAWYQ